MWTCVCACVCVVMHSACLRVSVGGHCFIFRACLLEIMILIMMLTIIIKNIQNSSS